MKHTANFIRLSIVNAVATISSAERQVNEFSSNNLNPPVWLTGQYYTASDGLLDMNLYVVQQVYI